jgi:hypothetical protein
MAQSPQFLVRHTRLPRPRVEPLEDRLLLALATLPDPASDDPSRHHVVLVAPLNPKSVGSQAAPLPQATNDPNLKADARADLDPDRRVDHREIEAGERVLDATLSAYLPALNQEPRAAAASPVQNETTPTPQSAELATNAAPGVVERLAILALRTRETNLADSADPVPISSTAERPTRPTEVAEIPATPPSSGDPPTIAEAVRTTTLPLDTPAFDLSAMKQEVDNFFARLADLGQTQGVNLSLPLVPTILVATALAYELNRRWGTKRTVPALPTEDFFFYLRGEES